MRTARKITWATVPERDYAVTAFGIFEATDEHAALYMVCGDKRIILRYAPARNQKHARGIAQAWFDELWEAVTEEADDDDRR